MPNEDDNITENVKYQVKDINRLVILGFFDTIEGAQNFLIDNPIYRRPEIKIIPTLTFRDMMSLDHMMSCLSDVYDEHKKTWFDNKVVNEIARDFVDKIDDIRSSKSVKDYIQ